MYKDKDKQREADRLRQQKHRQGVTAKGVTNSGFVTPEQPTLVTPSLEADPGWPPRWMTPAQWRAWMHQHRPNYCQALRLQAGIYRDYTDLPAGQFNRVSKPGDPDYVPPRGG